MPDSNIPTPRPYGVYSIRNAIDALWEECQLTAPQALIDWLGCSTFGGEVARQLHALAEITNGIADLVSMDASREAHDKAGRFQDGEGICDLLWFLSEQIAVLGSMADIASAASSWKDKPEDRARFASALGRSCCRA